MGREREQSAGADLEVCGDGGGRSGTDESGRSPGRAHPEGGERKRKGKENLKKRKKRKKNKTKNHGESRRPTYGC